MLDVTTIRKDFPVLDRRVHGRPLVYLDSAATSQKPQAVIDAMSRFYETSNANVHRGIHYLAEEATERYEAARAKVARFVGADPRGVVFTKNATEAFNLLAYCYARHRLGPGDILLSTQMEHHANIVPWQLVQPEAGFELAWAPIVGGSGPDAGTLDAAAFDDILSTGRVKLLTVTAMSNVLGTINPVAELAARARRARDDVLVVVDGAQSVPHLGSDLTSLGADVMCFSGHKMLGPTGIGVLTGDPELLEAMPPFLGGGEMISNVTLEGTTYNEVPYKFEAGTPPIAEAVGLATAIDYLLDVGMDRVRAHEVDIVGRAIPALQAVEGVTVHGPADPAARGAAVSFSIAGLHPHDIGTIMDREGVAVRAGHHCAKPLMRLLGTPATTRASFYLYNNTDEIDALVASIDTTKRFFGV